MDLSGILLKRTIEFYRENMISFDLMSFNVWSQKYKAIITIDYWGNLSAAPSNNYPFDILISRQEQYINNEVKKILNYLSKNYTIKQYYLLWPNFVELINRIIQISNTFRMAILELLYKKIMGAKNYLDFEKVLIFFDNFLCYLQNNTELNINQIDFKLILNLLENKEEFYPPINLINYKKKLFNIDENDLDFEQKSLLYLGEFIAPERVPLIAKSLLDYNEFSIMILPIFFALKDKRQALSFLRSCLTNNLTKDLIIKNAQNVGVSNNLQSLVRRL